MEKNQNAAGTGPDPGLLSVKEMEEDVRRMLFSAAKIALDKFHRTHDITFLTAASEAFRTATAGK